MQGQVEHQGQHHEEKSSVGAPRCLSWLQSKREGWHPVGWGQQCQRRAAGQAGSIGWGWDVLSRRQPCLTCLCSVAVSCDSLCSSL